MDEYGNTLDEIGINPDIEISNSFVQITKGYDNQLEYAIGLCKS
jgi:hypothetical protein